jgi:hypothetical protein
MKRFKLAAMISCFVFLALAFTPRIKAQTANEKTVMTFTEPFEVPGVGAQVLPAGCGGSGEPAVHCHARTNWVCTLLRFRIFHLYSLSVGSGSDDPLLESSRQ